MIHLLSHTGEAYGVPDLYDLRPIPEGHDRVVMLDRPATCGVELWRGPLPVARDLIHAIIHAVERASSGDVIDVAALAQRIQEGAQ